MENPVRRSLAGLAVLLAVAAPVASAATPGSSTALQHKLARALRVPHVSPARSAALAVDLSSGDVVYTQNGARPLEPASNEKLPITYAALSLLGSTYRFETDVVGEGSQDGEAWDGALVLKGGGDPTLTHWSLLALAKQVHAAGITSVTGGVVADESWFDARRTVAGWKSGFYLNESPPLSALVVDRDRVGGYLSTNPALAAGAAFRSALRKAGVTVTGPVRVGVADDYVVPLASIESPTLATIVRFMDRESDNFTAELLLKPGVCGGAARCRRQWDARGPHAQRPCPRDRDRQDGDDRGSIRVVRLRTQPLRVRRAAERPPVVVLVGARRAGPLRAGASGAVAREAAAR
jgi:D-alanyl-D-alanine carboxypeptidase